MPRSTQSGSKTTSPGPLALAPAGAVGTTAKPHCSRAVKGDLRVQLTHSGATGAHSGHLNHLC